MTFLIRPAQNSDADKLASARLSSEAFGYSLPTDPGDLGPLDAPGQTMYLAERDGVVVGKARDLHYDSWFGGCVVPTSGVASVTVATEERGRGTMRAVMLELMRGARERGAAVSTLVPTAPAAYRPCGHESITTYEHLRLPTASLAPVTRGSGTTRRATAADRPALAAVYDAWARAQNGPLTRRGPAFGDPDQVFQTHAITLALDPAGETVGYAAWKHTGGYYGGGLLEVDDLVATTLDGYRLLLGALGSSAAVAPTTELLSSGSSGLDLLRLVVPGRSWPAAEIDHYMLAVLDVVAAFEARGYVDGIDTTVRFGVGGAPLAGVDGTYELAVEAGRGRCRRLADVVDAGEVPVFDARGLALWFAGAQSCANIAAVGGLTGAPAPGLLDALMGGRQVHIRDSF